MDGQHNTSVNMRAVPLNDSGKWVCQSNLYPVTDIFPVYWVPDKTSKNISIREAEALNGLKFLGEFVPTWSLFKTFPGHKAGATCTKRGVSSPLPQQSSWRRKQERKVTESTTCTIKTYPHLLFSNIQSEVESFHHDVPCGGKLPAPWWRRLCWESLTRPRPWCTPSRRNWSALWRSVD